MNLASVPEPSQDGNLDPVPMHWVLDRQQPINLRMDALHLMIEQFHPEYVAQLGQLIADTSEPADIRSAAALALAKAGQRQRPASRPGSMATRQQVFDILSARVHDPDKTLRNYVVQALGILAMEEAAPLLIEALKDPNNTVFASAAEALGKLGRPVVPHLVTLLHEGADDARCVAAWQLGEIGESSATSALVQGIQNDKNQDVVALAIWALGQIGEGPADVMDVLRWARNQAEPEIRLRAEMALKKIVRHQN
jgi:HEAT repeat protein